MRSKFLLVLLLGFSAHVTSQMTKPTDSSTTWHTFKYDMNASWRGVKHAVTRPLHWKGKDFAKMGGMFVGTAVVSLADKESSDYFVGIHDDFPQPIQEFGYYLSKPQYFLMLNAGIYSVGLFTKNEQLRKTSVLIISSSITAGYLQIFARSAFGRARPYSGKDPFTFKPFADQEKYFSFPSGHTVLATTLAHSIAKQFENTWAKVAIYTIGSVPAITRLVEGAHWLSDVAFGAALGIVVVDGIDKFLFQSKTYDYPRKNRQVSWNLKFSGNQIGVVGSF